MTKEEFYNGSLVVKEVESLHSFFQKWFTGDLPQERFSRFENVIADDFELITPSAETHDKDTILNLVKNGYNTQQYRKIWTEFVKTRQVNDVIIATYHELQSTQSVKNRRLSTAVFTYDPTLPNNCRWRQVHETWINETE